MFFSTWWDDPTISKKCITFSTLPKIKLVKLVLLFRICPTKISLRAIIDTCLSKETYGVEKFIIQVNFQLQVSKLSDSLEKWSENPNDVKQLAKEIGLSNKVTKIHD